MTYEHACPNHGRFELRYSIHDPERVKPCPDCQEASPRVLAVSTDQFLVPEHFQTTLPVTGFRTNTGGSGEYENLQRSFNRWDSGCAGIKDKDKRRRQKERKQKLVDFAKKAVG